LARHLVDELMVSAETAEPEPAAGARWRRLRARLRKE
jgi:hypothetical protein